MAEAGVGKHGSVSSASGTGNRENTENRVSVEGSHEGFNRGFPSPPFGLWSHDTPFHRRHTSLDLSNYFVGPCDTQKHSKWPVFLQMHGSILPKMALPLTFVGLWATMVTSILLTVTGFVVGLCLSFRCSTAYEKYAEGRRYWAQLILASQSLARVFWVHSLQREGEDRETDMLSRLTALNLLVAFAVALKHKLRFEPYTGYDDLVHLVGHLDTYARDATAQEPEKMCQRKPSLRKVLGEYLGVSFAASNPRKTIKRAEHALGNLPLEILTYLACFTDELVANGQLTVSMHQTLAYNNIAALNDVLMGTERVLTTPLPVAYSIAIAQIAWIYVLLLPFQLYPALHWVAIPATLAASYIILGILFIGREIENPFGRDVNDLPLESYCMQVACELDIIASQAKHRRQDWMEMCDNKVLFPLSTSGWPEWRQRGEAKMHEALRRKAAIGMEARKAMGSVPGAPRNGHQADVVSDVGSDDETIVDSRTGSRRSSSQSSRSTTAPKDEERYGKETV